MARKKKFDYFEAFIKISDYAVKYADELVKYMEKNAEIAGEGREPDIEHAIKRYEELHDLEEKSDGVRHDLAEALSVEFLAPIEREDVMVMADELDDLVDDLDEVLQRMYMYDVHVVDKSVLEMMKYAHEATEAVHELCKQFHNFKKPPKLKKYIIAVHDVEKKADGVYIHAVHEIYAHAKEVGMTSIDAMGQARMLDTLEAVCDKCEDIAGTIAMVMMKNS